MRIALAPTASSASFAFALLLLPVLPVLPACDFESLFAECDGDSDCDDDEECSDDGKCEELECTKDSDCDTGEECRSDECKRISCTIDADCDDEEAFCDVDGKCREIPGGEGEGEEGEGEEGEGEEGEGEEGEGEEGEGEDPCNGVPAEGQCNGDIIELCVDNSFVDTFNCNSPPFPAGQTDCQFIGAFDAIGCAVESGSQCVLEGGESIASCQGSNAGCRLDDDSSGTCVTNAFTCSSSDVNTCDGERFVLGCGVANGGFDGQPEFLDCGGLGGSCESFGCLFAPGEACVPNISQCGDTFESAVCPANGLCPGGGGLFTHHTGTGVTFTNDRPIDTTSAQGAIDACNAHFGITSGCGVGCGSGCSTVVLDSVCSCTAAFVWHFGGNDCYLAANTPASVVTGPSCGGAVGNWD